MPLHLDLLQQYAGTNGLCHIWAVAIRETLQSGRVVALMAKDKRTFEAHDWPEGEPLELHRFVLLPDGAAVDAQGTHEMDEMLAKFGISHGVRHSIDEVPPASADLVAMAAEKPAWAEAAVLRRDVLAGLGWDGAAPRYDGELERNWKAVSRKVQEDGVPEPEVSSPSASVPA